MKKILIINGPNLNLLGEREVELYGVSSLKELTKKLNEKYPNVLDFYQSNYEGDIVTKIQNAKNNYDGIVINGGAYAHTSIAILDALKAVKIRTINVHITDVALRESFRQQDFIKLYAEKTISGHGIKGYEEGIEILLNQDEN